MSASDSSDKANVHTLESKDIKDKDDSLRLPVDEHIEEEKGHSKLFQDFFQYICSQSGEAVGVFDESKAAVAA